MEDGIKIVFGLPDGSAYAVESLWAIPMANGGYLIDNIPWYVSDIALGDVVGADARDDGRLHFNGEVLRRSGNQTIRLRLAEESHRHASAIQEALERLGAESEVDPSQLMAINAPASGRDAVRKFLEAGALQGHWVFV
jgi:hypothetical protein